MGESKQKDVPFFVFPPLRKKTMAVAAHGRGFIFPAPKKSASPHESNSKKPRGETKSKVKTR